MQCIEERACQLVVPGRNGAIYLEMTDHPLDVIASTIDAFVPGDFSPAIGLWRNAGTDARVLQAGADGVGIVALVGEKVGRLGLGQSGHVFECRAVRGFAGREVEDERDAPGITETMNFTGEPAPRAAKSLFASPPFAPAAET